MVTVRPRQGNRHDPTPLLWRRQRDTILKHLVAQEWMRDKLFRLWVELAFSQDDYCCVTGYRGVSGVMTYLDLDETGRRLGRTRGALNRDLRALETSGLALVERNGDQVRIVLIGLG